MEYFVSFDIKNFFADINKKVGDIRHDRRQFSKESSILRISLRNGELIKM